MLPASVESAPMKDDKRRYELMPPPPSGEEARAFRELWGRTQAQAARICRVNLSTYAGWEAGRSRMPLAAWHLLRITCDPKARKGWLRSL
jgi:DNA-binding transcriptional regulator YiaG